MMRHILELELGGLEGILKNWDAPCFYARQIFSWIYKKGASDFGAMTDLPAALRKRLSENFFIRSAKVIKALESRDGTEKFLFQLWDKNLIEAVLIPAQGRATGCISTQAGCKFACQFCASGALGFRRNLTCGEILEQVKYLKERGRLTHIVFMGIGEPLDNYENVLKAIRIINSPRAFNIGARRITISTCGIIPGIKKLSAENLQIELSVSLHAADSALRSRILPVNKKYPLRELVACCKEYIRKTRRQITFEYVLVRGLNSDLQNAALLCKIIKELGLAKVNLIPANSVKELGITAPEKKEVLLFRNFLMRNGAHATLRKPRGQDIEAACGQLRLRHERENRLQTKD